MAFIATVGVASGPLLAQGRSAAEDPVTKIRLLKPNLYLITGGGANTVVRVTAEGVIVVDTKNPGENRYDRMMEEIKSVTDEPVKYVLNTHHHPDHVGNNKQFIDAGATVIQLEALKADQLSDSRTKEIPGVADQTFAKDYVLKFGGAEVDAHFYGRGHTGDDTMIYFPAEKVVMVSDQMSDGAPGIGVGTGGSLLEWNRSLDGVLNTGRFFSSRCPHCRSIDFRSAGARNALESAFKWLVQPYWCSLCGHHLSYSDGKFQLGRLRNPGGRRDALCSALSGPVSDGIASKEVALNAEIHGQTEQSS